MAKDQKVKGKEILTLTEQEIYLTNCQVKFPFKFQEFLCTLSKTEADSPAHFSSIFGISKHAQTLIKSSVDGQFKGPSDV